MVKAENFQARKNKDMKKRLRAWYKNWQLYVLALPALAIIIAFNYVPMYGIIIAFKDYNSINGIWGSKFADPILKHFQTFVNDPYFWDMLWNTLRLSLLSLLFFPFPIIFALLINEIKNKTVKNKICNRIKKMCKNEKRLTT